MNRCTLCRRPVLNPVMLGEPGSERGYGPKCAQKVSPVTHAKKPKRVRIKVRPQKPAVEQDSQLDLLDELIMANYF